MVAWPGLSAFEALAEVRQLQQRLTASVSRVAAGTVFGPGLPTSGCKHCSAEAQVPHGACSWTSEIQGRISDYSLHKPSCVCCSWTEWQVVWCSTVELYVEAMTGKGVWDIHSSPPYCEAACHWGGLVGHLCWGGLVGT
jgi:hypothetical protein